MNLKLKIWRQSNANARRVSSWTIDVNDVSPDMSFLEMLDVLE